jgi:hypothetical protein
MNASSTGDPTSIVRPAAAATDALPGSSIGGYDGVEMWTVRTWVPAGTQGRVVASLHERLHHELQNTTLWGLLVRFCDDFRLAGVNVVTTSAAFWIGVLRSQQVHETYATTLATGIDAPSVELLPDNPHYAAHRRRGLALLNTTDQTWSTDRFLIDGLLRACMMGRGLIDIARDLPKVSLRALESELACPDTRLRRLSEIDHSPLRAELGTIQPESIDELRQLHDLVAAHLNRLGVPTLTTAEYAEAVQALTDRVSRLLPHLSIDVDDRRDDVIEDALEELQRERIELHEQPLPLEVIPFQTVGTRTTDFLRRHEVLGPHLLAVWIRADLLARQFRRPNQLDGHDGHVLALQAADVDDAGDPIVRLALAENVTDLAELASGLDTIAVVFLSTQASILDAPDNVRFSGRNPIHVLVDQPILEQLRHTFDQGASIRWARVDLGGDRELTLFVFEVDALPYVRYLHLALEVGADALTRWLLRHRGSVRQDSSVFSDDAARLEAVVQHIVAAWWRLDQIGARRA